MYHVCAIRTFICCGCLTLASVLVLAQGIRPEPLTPIPIQQVQLDDEFWAPRMKLWREVTIPDCLDKFEKDGALANFDKVRDGTGGEHGGPPWYDGLIYEMIRGSADFLAAAPDPGLEVRLDSYIERIAGAAAQDQDGYLNTYTQLKEPDHRWGANGGNDRWQHDLYNAGALVEAGVHYYRATGKIRLLEVATKLANHMSDTMGPPPRQNLVPGHALGEESLVSLYQLFQEQPQLKERLSVPVDERRYLELAEFWIDARGNHSGRTNFGAYNQDAIPVVEQQTIEGHAVRAVLLCSGLVAAGQAGGRTEYLATAQRLWENMVSRRMYLTGGVGAESNDEKFGPDYYLPNTGYAETCASAASALFHHQMNLCFGDAKYADEFERVLYNGALAGVSSSGQCYFYENPLESGPGRKRWEWHGCPCCPPMFLKLMGALPGCLYAQGSDGVFVNLYAGSRASLSVEGVPVGLRQRTEYPWDGRVRIDVNPDRPVEFALNLRLPGWCSNPLIELNGRETKAFAQTQGYASLKRRWKRGDKVELLLPMPPRRVYANPRVEADAGRVALQRGPIVYCFEAQDNGGTVRNLVLPAGAPMKVEASSDLPGVARVLSGNAQKLNAPDWGNRLYVAGDRRPGLSESQFMAIPYFANANREPGEMQVWVAESPLKARPMALPSLANRARPSASHCGSNDSVAALNDQLQPATSDDATLPRFTWWDHRGTREWVQYDFDAPTKVSSVSVYWWDETRVQAYCRVPESWRVVYRRGDRWEPVSGAQEFGTAMDRFNRADFTPVSTSAIRLEVQLQSGWSGGVLEWRVE